eukprot:3625856-Heterocapsa_arctica.AAC.1
MTLARTPSRLGLSRGTSGRLRQRDGALPGPILASRTALERLTLPLDEEAAAAAPEEEAAAAVTPPDEEASA